MNKIVDQALTSGIPRAQRSDQRDPWTMIRMIFNIQDQIPRDPSRIHALTREIPADPYPILGRPTLDPCRPGPLGPGRDQGSAPGMRTEQDQERPHHETLRPPLPLPPPHLPTPTPSSAVRRTEGQESPSTTGVHRDQP